MYEKRKYGSKIRYRVTDSSDNFSAKQAARLIREYGIGAQVDTWKGGYAVWADKRLSESKKDAIVKKAFRKTRPEKLTKLEERIKKLKRKDFEIHSEHASYPLAIKESNKLHDAGVRGQKVVKRAVNDWLIMVNWTNQRKPKSSLKRTMEKASRRVDEMYGSLEGPEHGGWQAIDMTDYDGNMITGVKPKRGGLSYNIVERGSKARILKLYGQYSRGAIIVKFRVKWAVAENKNAEIRSESSKSVKVTGAFAAAERAYDSHSKKVSGEGIFGPDGIEAEFFKAAMLTKMGRKTTTPTTMQYGRKKFHQLRGYFGFGKPAQNAAKHLIKRGAKTVYIIEHKKDWAHIYYSPKVGDESEKSKRYVPPREAAKRKRKLKAEIRVLPSSEFPMAPNVIMENREGTSKKFWGWNLWPPTSKTKSHPIDIFWGRIGAKTFRMQTRVFQTKGEMEDFISKKFKEKQLKGYKVTHTKGKGGTAIGKAVGKYSVRVLDSNDRSTKEKPFSAKAKAVKYAKDSTRRIPNGASVEVYKGALRIGFYAIEEDGSILSSGVLKSQWARRVL